ncbi:response regulator transcription factor [Sphingosinicella sp. BN140058]|uniref:response regulator n=1 Tax=Sphingosinicella sp. BN140058 TaxID=1892855 RepID=UPI0010118D59|nr:response regulator transcription factor [Sphingosinicella sp. BN140058]QAY76113.1 response regulator transcription factor [Sphingosinicella sp. BN140058]
MSIAPKPAGPIRVLIVDDHPMVRDGISEMLARQSDMEMVGEASDGAEAIAAFQAAAPDVTLMDVQMPGMSGIEAIAGIRSISGEARILVLTTYAGDVNALRAIRAGAAGYLLKTCVRGELVDAIRAVHSGRRVVSPEIAHALAEHALDDPLTERETAILRLVADGRSNKEIARHLALSVDSIKAQLKSIFAKLDVHDRTHAVTIARRRGHIEP